MQVIICHDAKREIHAKEGIVSTTVKYERGVIPPIKNLADELKEGRTYQLVSLITDLQNVTRKAGTYATIILHDVTVKSRPIPLAYYGEFVERIPPFFIITRGKIRETIPH
jgi:hypothetical protein